VHLVDHTIVIPLAVTNLLMIIYFTGDSKGNAHGETSLDVLIFSPNHQHIPCGKEELYDHASIVSVPQLMQEIRTFNLITSKLLFIADFPWTSKHTYHFIGRYNWKGE
ncbi:hypothetical protein ACJX0J_030691, partial [Zea mays]